VFSPTGGGGQNGDEGEISLIGGERSLERGDNQSKGGVEKEDSLNDNGNKGKKKST